jgi:NitT/TauT family transport system permease protein
MRIDVAPYAGAFLRDDRVVAAPAGDVRQRRGRRLAEQLACGAAGIAGFLALWFALVHFHVWRFDKVPSPVDVATEWFSPNPAYGVSIFTANYYTDILASVRRVAFAFALAAGFGIPTGILLGWNQTAREYLFPLLELIRPIPPLAWVALAVLVFPSQELAIVFLTWIAEFFAMVLNTMHGVASIDKTYVRAARCLGASEAAVIRHIVLPGALPAIFTGLQVAMGTAWFSLVAGELISGSAGLGYEMLNAYQQLQMPTIVIAMITLGLLGFASSTAVRWASRRVLAWQRR